MDLLPPPVCEARLDGLVPLFNISTLSSYSVKTRISFRVDALCDIPLISTGNHQIPLSLWVFKGATEVAKLKKCKGQGNPLRGQIYK